MAGGAGAGAAALRDELLDARTANELQQRRAVFGFDLASRARAGL